MAELNTGNGANILSALANLAPLLIGSGKTTTKGAGTNTTTTGGTVNKTSSAASINALTALLGSDAANPDKAGSIVNAATKNAINLMLQQGVPSIGAAERGSGIYNSSQTAQAMSQLEGQTAAAAAKMQVDQTNTAAALQGQVATNLGELTSSTTTNNVVTNATAENRTSKQDAAINPLYSALALGAGVAFANRDSIASLLGFGDSSNKKSRSSDYISPSFESFSPTFASPQVQQPTTSLLDTLDFSAPNAIGNSLANFGTDIVGGMKAATTDSMGNTSTGGIDELKGAAESTLISSVLGGLFDFFTGGSSSSGSDSGSSSGGGTVICTRLHELGYMDDETYAADVKYGKLLESAQPEFVAWYRRTAAPLVAAMHHKRWINRLLCRLVAIIARPWCAHMRYEDNFSAKVGAAIEKIGYFCFLISTILSKNPEEIKANG